MEMDSCQDNPYGALPPRSYRHLTNDMVPRSSESVGASEPALKPRRTARRTPPSSGDGSGSAKSTTSSQYRGVSWHGPSKQWRATIFASA